MKTLRLLLLAPLFVAVALAADGPAPAALPPQIPSASGAATGPVVQADPAAVEAVLKAMHYDEMMGKVLNQQKQAALAFTRQMLARANVPGTSKEDLAAFPQKAVDTAWAALNLADVHAAAARIYSEVFTTDELHAMADFYNSPTGQSLLVKQPDVQQKIGAMIRPLFMQVMPKIQKMTQDFSAQQQAKARDAAMKAQAQKAAAATGASPAAAPLVPPKS
jgi:hypothetical protein